MSTNENKNCIFQGDTPHFGNKIIPVKYEKKNEKSLGELPGDELLYTKSTGFMSDFLDNTKKGVLIFPDCAKN